MTEVRLVSKTLDGETSYYLAKVNTHPKTNEITQSIPLMTLPAVKSVDEMGKILVKLAEALAKPAIEYKDWKRSAKLPFIDIIDSQINKGRLEADTPKEVLEKVLSIVYILSKAEFSDKLKDMDCEEDLMYFSIMASLGRAILNHPLLNKYLDN